MSYTKPRPFKIRVHHSSIQTGVLQETRPQAPGATLNISQNRKPAEDGASSRSGTTDRRKTSEVTSGVTSATSQSRLNRPTSTNLETGGTRGEYETTTYGSDDDAGNKDADKFSEDLNEENAFGYQYRSYLSGSPLVNNLLIFWHMLLMVASVAMLGAGIALRYHFSWFVITQVKTLPIYENYKKYIHEVDPLKTKIALSSYVDDSGVMLMVFHGSYLFSMFIYMTYPIHKIQFTLPIGSIITGAVALAEVTIVNIVYAPTLISRQDLVEDLQDKLKTDYSVSGTNLFTVSYDYISVWLQCCGIIDRYDFQDVNLEMQTVTSVIKLEVAPTCCQRKFFSATSTSSVDQCAQSGEEIQEVGCFSKIVETILLVCKFYTILIWVHLADCCVHATLYKRRIAFLSRVLEYKSERQDQFMKYLMKRKKEKEEMEMKTLFGNRERPPGAQPVIP